MRVVAFILLAALSVVLSVFVSQIYFGLCLKMIPPAALSDFNRSAGRAVFLFWGVIFGLALTALQGLVLWMTPALRKGEKPPA